MTATTGDARPLHGRRVLVTRPRAQAGELVLLLESAGAEVVVAPTIRIAAPVDPEPLLRAAATVSSFDWIVFASVNAVDAFLDAIATPQPLPRVCAVGSRTAERLRERGIDVAIVPAEFRAEALLAALANETTLAGARVLLPRSEIGRVELADGLRTAGALVTDVIAYRTVSEEAGEHADDVRRLMAQGRVDAVTFTSGSSLRNFVHMFGPDSVGWLQRTAVAVIGPVTAEVAHELGVPVHIQPATYTVPAMVDAMSRYFVAGA